MQESNILVKEDERLDRVNEDILLLQKKDGLTFGTDAYLLAAYVRPKPALRGVDLGSGTGILPLLLLSKRKIASMTAVEVQPAFSELIERNAEINGFKDAIQVFPADLRKIGAKDLGGEVDLVISNPPYLKANAGKENRAQENAIARHELSGDIFDFCAAAGRLLKYGGRFYSVYRPDRLSDLIAALRVNHLEPKRITLVYPDEESKPCLVLTEAQKGAKASLNLTKPFFLYTLASKKNKLRELTKDAAAVYDNCSFTAFEKPPTKGE